VAALMRLFIADIKMSGIAANAITGISRPLSVKTAMKQSEFTEMIKGKFAKPASRK